MFPVCLAAQTLNSQEEKLMDDFIRKNLKYEKSLVPVEATGKVFAGNFYIVSAGFSFLDGVSYCSDFFFCVKDGALFTYEQLTTDMELPLLLSLVKKDFLLKDEAGAKLFETALNTLYPVRDSEKGDVKHLKKGNQWIFLRGKFFDDQTAVLVTIDAKGVITKLEIKLSYKVV